MKKKFSALSSTALMNTNSNDFLEKEKNPLKRHLLKTISYRIIATLITISSALILGLDIKASALLGIGEILIKPFFYFLHERVWYNLRFKKKKYIKKIIMEKKLDYCCDKCEVEMEIFDLGILSSLENECDFTTNMICLCKPCTLKREVELKSELALIQYAIKHNIKGS